MKRALALLLLAALIAGCVSCARADKADPDSFVDLTTFGVKPDVTASAVLTDEPRASEPAFTEAAFTQAATAEPTPAATGTPEPSPTAAEVTASPAPSPTPTPAPTAAPTAAPTTAPTQGPTPSPVPQPDPNAGISFSESSSLPLPSLNEDVPYGQPFCFGGVVTSSAPLLSVTAVITASNGQNISKSVTFGASDNVLSVELVDRTFPKTGNASLTYKVKFEELPAGNYVFSLYASSTASSNVLLKASQFRIVNSEWRRLISNNLRNNYAYALSFFGSRDQFMFLYKWGEGRNITTESGWVENHMTSVTSPTGGRWYVHNKAKPYYEQAINYLNNTFVRVTWSNGAHDSGVIRLRELIRSFDGTLNTRFVSDRTFVSHHSFGTAIDLNASMDANVNNIANRNVIRDEVRDRLAYNGIKQQGGVSYYEFTYSGTHSSTYNGVPTTVINYLLYELAFFRAGFNWGYYYLHTCDGMHFGLSEMSADIHNTSSRSLRKVYSYI